MYINNFPKIISGLMKAHNLTQLKLAGLVGVRQSQVHNWLTGVNTPGYSSMIKLCNIFEIKPNDLFTDDLQIEFADVI